MRTLEYILAGWVIISIPVALFLGRFIKVGSEHPTADERFAQQAGEQR